MTAFGTLGFNVPLPGKVEWAKTGVVQGTRGFGVATATILLHSFMVIRQAHVAYSLLPALPRTYYYHFLFSLRRIKKLLLVRHAKVGSLCYFWPHSAVYGGAGGGTYPLGYTNHSRACHITLWLCRIENPARFRLSSYFVAAIVVSTSVLRAPTVCDVLL